MHQAVLVGLREYLHLPTFVINVDLGKFCNYSCSYCWPESHSSVRDHLATTLIIDGLAEVRRQAKQNGFSQFCYSMTGGEPTLHPDLIDIAASLHDDQFHSYQMVSNMTRGPNWWQTFYDAAGHFDRIVITASWHSEGHQSCAEFSDKTLALATHNIFTSINIVMVPAMWDRLMDDATFFYDRGHNISIIPQDIGHTGHQASYTDDQWQMMQTAFPHRGLHRPKQAYSPIKRPREYELHAADDAVTTMSATALSAYGYTRYEGWQCHAGFQSVNISSTGVVYRGIRCRDEPLGTLRDGFRLLDQPEPCITGVCGCNFDLYLPKRLNTPEGDRCAPNLSSG